MTALLAAGGASAALPPDEITFPARNGAVRFTHRNHFSAHVDGCKVCHAPQGRYSRQLPHVYGKVAAHQFCLGCHQQREPAPMRCSQCHDPSAGRAPALEPPGEPPPGPVAPEPWPPRLEPIQVLRDPGPSPAATATAAPAATPAPAPSPEPEATPSPARAALPRVAAVAPPAPPARPSAPPTVATAAPPAPAPATPSAPPAAIAAPPAPTLLPPRRSAPEPASGRMLTPGESEMQMVREIEEAEARAAAERARRPPQ